MYKPFIPISRQIELMRSRGMIVGNDAEEILQREGYYSIVNGYKDPFLDVEATQAAHDDRFQPGTTFNQLYELFLFDRNLRFLFFKAITEAESLLRTICSYVFSESHPNEKNAYLNRDNYIQEGERQEKADSIIRTLNKVIRKSTENGTGKDYMIHCLTHHDGEIPLWVLVNDLTLGQIYWFFQSLTMSDRGAIARTFTSLYDKSHKYPVVIESPRLDTVYRRVKDFRNICAHDERLYCAHPHDLNANVFQLACDLRFLTTKPHYLEFLQKLRSLLVRMESEIHEHSEYVYSAMGLTDIGQLDGYMKDVRRC